MIDNLLFAAAMIAAWWLGVCSMALWQNWKARPSKPIGAELMPQRLVDDYGSKTTDFGITDSKRRERPINSPFAPKPKRKAAGLRQRLDGLKHWPTTAAEIPRRPDKSGTMEGPVESYGNAITDRRPARTVLPLVEFGSGAKPLTSGKGVSSGAG